MKIIGSKVNLRPFERSDYNTVLQWSNDKLLSYYWGRELPSSIEECKDRYMQKTYLLKKIFAIEDKKGQLLGEIELSHISWKIKRAELSIYIGDRSFWGKGYGSDALGTFLEYIFNEKGFNSIYLKVYEQNSRAIKCYEKCGFRKKGVLRFRSQRGLGDNVILMELTADHRDKISM